MSILHGTYLGKVRLLNKLHLVHRILESVFTAGGNNAGTTSIQYFQSFTRKN
jgi:hypothetical protein